MAEKFRLGINVNDPWEYYGTDNINNIPDHLITDAILYIKGKKHEI